MKKLLFFFLIALLSQTSAVYAQRENKWAFGIHAGADFSSGSPVAITTGINGGDPSNLEGIASVCDSSGQLLFYTEGTYVWDKNQNLLPNGSDLINSGFTDPYDNPTAGTAQGALIVPMPDSANKYYIFSLQDYDFTQGATVGKLFYSVLDMNLNGGLGDIVPGRKGIPLDTSGVPLTEKMTAVVGNCCIWLLVCNSTPAFEAYQITAGGINPTPVVSEVGLGLGDPNNFATIGTMCVSPNRLKLAATAVDLSGSDSASLAVYDFDPATGLVSNPVKLILASDTDAIAYGVCFSADNSKIYNTMFLGGMHNSIYQFDLNTDNPATIHDTRLDVGKASESQIKLATNGKVYFFTDTSSSPGFGTAPFMGCFNTPDLAGTASQYIPMAVTLLSGTSSGVGLPNVVPEFRTLSPLTISANGNILGTTNSFENYQWYLNSEILPNETGANLTITQNGVYSVKVSNSYGCTDSTADTISNLAASMLEHAGNGIAIYPNPASNNLTVSVTGNKNEKGTIEIIDALGRIVLTQPYNGTRQEVNVVQLPAGVYQLQYTNSVDLSNKLQARLLIVKNQ